MVDWAVLEKRYLLIGIGGSNPPASEMSLANEEAEQVNCFTRVRIRSPQRCASLPEGQGERREGRLQESRL